jgi:hypothetical protein
LLVAKCTLLSAKGILLTGKCVLNAELRIN